MRTWLIAFLSSPSGFVFDALAVVVLAGLLTVAFRRVLLADDPQGDTASPVVALAALLAAAALVVPLVFTIASPDVFVIPKLTALRVTLIVGLVLLGLGASRLVAVAAPPASRPVRVMDLALIAYVGLTALATVGSIDRGLSLVGREEQYQGLLTTLLFVAFFYLARISVTDLRRLCLLMIAATAGCTIVAAYAVLQQLHLDPIWGDLYNGRVFSTIGQAEWLGAYLVLCAGLGAALLWQLRGYRRFLVAAALGIIVIAVLLTLSRGAYLALGVAAAVFVTCLAPGARPSRRLLLAVPAVGIVAVSVLAVPPLRSEAETVISRAASTADLGEGSIEGRLDMWRVGAAIAIDHPILGTGPETYTLLFPQYRDSLLASRREFWLAYAPESPHNVYLAIAAGSGIPALAAYLALIGAIFVQLLRGLRAAADRSARIALAAILAGAAGHLVADLFMTADIAGAWLVWMILGTGVGYAEAVRRSATRSQAPEAISPGNGAQIPGVGFGGRFHGRFFKSSHAAPPRIRPRTMLPAQKTGELMSIGTPKIDAGPDAGGDAGPDAGAETGLGEGVAEGVADAADSPGLLDAVATGDGLGLAVGVGVGVAVAVGACVGVGTGVGTAASMYVLKS